MALFRATFLLVLVAVFLPHESFSRPIRLPFPEALHKLKDASLVAAIKNSETAFASFLARHGKNYTGADFLVRLTIFEQNLLRAVKNQLADPEAVHGITQFSDLTEEEFARGYLGLHSKVPSSIQHGPPLPVDDLPEEFDWREKGAVSKVKNQGMCGSCYAFSTTGAVEGAHFLATGKLISLSEQQIVDCDKKCDPTEKDVCDSGCSGGLMSNALQYIMDAGGLELESEYPYAGTENRGGCSFDSSKAAATVQSFTQVPVEEEQIAAHLVKYGPLAVGINANWMQTYVRGVSCPLLCDKRGLNHGVLLVGYGQHGFSPARLKFKPYWVIKNSWGPLWGESGYYRICSGKDECGLNTMISAVLHAGDGPAGKQGHNQEKVEEVVERQAQQQVE